ncbi:MAG: MFS transporter [Nanoarchaeota archaeon]|nr:MFS transporter [Nanoarchaeota archaeon]
MLFNKVKHNIRKCYAYQFLDQFSLFLPFIVFYFQEFGFSLGQIAIMIGVRSLTIFLFEIPSGYFADKFGRKNSIILSSLLQASSIAVLFTANSYYLFILAHILLGLAIAFLSGANEALLYDSLLELKREKEFKKIYGKSRFYGEIAVIISSLLAALAISSGVKFTILVTLIGHVLLSFLSLSFKEPKRHKLIENQTLKQELKQMGSIIKRSVQDSRLLKIFTYMFIILGISNIAFMIYQPYFRATNLPLPQYGVVFAIFAIFTGIASLKAHKIENKLGVFKSLIFIPIFLVITFLGVGISFVWWGAMFFFFREFVRGFISPVLGDYINKITKSKERATVLSVGSMFSRLGFVILSAIFGFSSDNWGLKIVLISTGLFLLVLTILIPLAMKTKQTPKLI